ncbi:MAG: late competence development ComFB family protein [Pseudomonadales bacterium]|nr:late competence development ComFB family protein [Pseudomonadales bacterium]NRA17102.1 late competence development ComFB family protein [Oceanospirillaceae bacterium]
MQLDLDIHNFYEHLVVEHLEDNNYSRDYEKEFLADLCCLALTQLPARYIRHDIDMAFFLNADERKEMSEEVDAAIDLAFNYLQSKGEE